MKRISITGIVATTIWLSFVVMGYQGIQGVIDQHAAGYPSAGQIRFYVIFPSVVAVAAALSIVCFWFGHLKVLASIVQVLSLAALFPYLFFYTGGTRAINSAAERSNKALHATASPRVSFGVGPQNNGDHETIEWSSS